MELSRRLEAGYQYRVINVHPPIPMSTVSSFQMLLDMEKAFHGLRIPSPLRGTRQPAGQGSKRVFTASCHKTLFRGSVQSFGATVEK